MIIEDNIMIWNNKYNYLSSTKALFNGYRHYDINNEKLPSVTSIIEKTKTEEEKASLKLWRERIGEAAAQKISKDAASRGGAMHKYIELFLKNKLNGDLIEEDNKPKKMAEIIIENGLKGKVQEIWGVEATLYYPGKYAGSADTICIYNGIPSILDYKQSNKLRKPEWNINYMTQISAYVLAHNTVYQSKITQGVVLLCTVDNLFQNFKIEGDKLIEYQKKFLEKVKQYYEQKFNK